MYIGNDPAVSPIVAAVRQAVLSAPLDANGYNAALSAGSGLRLALDASPTNVVLAYARGHDAGGNADEVEAISSDSSDIIGSDLAASNTSFIYKNFGGAWGAALVPPQYGYAFDKGENALLNFEGSNGATSTTDDFGNTWTLSGATISTTQAKFGSSSLRLGSGSDAATCTGITSMGGGSWTIQGWFRPDTGAVAQVYFCGYDASGTYGIQLQTSGSGALQLYLSSTGSSWDVSGGSLGSTALANGTWYRIRLTFDALAGTYRVYLSNNGAAETQEITVSSTARIIGLTSFHVGRPAGSGIIGYVDGFQLIRCATNTSTETPGVSAPAITDYPVHFFSIPDMKMYEVTAASASAGTNPTLTERSRLFVGEADTNGSAVTAVRNYAIRGQYESILTTQSAALTGYSFSHNIGTRNYTANSFAKVISSFGSYNIGDRIYDFTDGNSGTGGALYGIWKWMNSRNSIQLVTGADVHVPIPSSPGIITGAIYSYTRFGVLVRRAF